MSLDLSKNSEHRGTAAVVRDLKAVAELLKIDFLIIGAAARDLMLHAYGQESPRLTKDVDFAVLVPTWERFDALRTGILHGQAFRPDNNPVLHRVIHVKTDTPVDIVPFGGIENEGRIITFPPDHEVKFDCFGVQEAYGSRVEIRLPDDVSASVATIPAQVLLKTAAFGDRKYDKPGRDAPDLMLLLRRYIDCGAMQGVGPDAQSIFDVSDFDAEIAGAQLLAREMKKLLDQTGLARVLAPEVDVNGNLLLIRQSNVDEGTALRVLKALVDGLAA